VRQPCQLLDFAARAFEQALSHLQPRLIRNCHREPCIVQPTMIRLPWWVCCS
jgi:hypothetical protein